MDISPKLWIWLGVDPKASGQPCGCDPAAGHMCDTHIETIDRYRMFACVGCGLEPWNCTCRRESER